LIGRGFQPHFGDVSRDDFEVQFSGIFGRVAAHVAGAPINVVNPEVLGEGGLKRGGDGIYLFINACNCADAD
jgi:hypothetical protein